MKKADKNLFLAVLLIMPWLQGVKQTLAFASLACLSWWAILCFFHGAARLFPKRFFFFTMIMTLAFLAYGVWLLSGLPPFWVFPAFVLLAVSMHLQEGVQKMTREQIIHTGAVFIFTACAIAGIYEWILPARFALTLSAQWWLLVYALSLLLLWENLETTEAFHLIKNPFWFLRQMVRLLWQTFLLIAFEHTLFHYWPPYWAYTWIFFGGLPLAYGLGRMEKDSKFFFVATFGLALISTVLASHFWILSISFAFCAVIGLGFLQLLCLGMMAQLSFYAIPKAFEGMPAFFVTSGVLIVVILSLLGAG